MESFALCLAAMALIASDKAPEQSHEYRAALGHNVCAAAEHEKIAAPVLIATILNENGRLNTHAVGKAVQGADYGLCQINSAAHPAIVQKGQAIHPYFCAAYAARMLKGFFAKYGDSWQAIASYWSPKQASMKTQGAWEYYVRWDTQRLYTMHQFGRAKATLNSGSAANSGQQAHTIP
jgi:hypothetical protein